MTFFNSNDSQTQDTDGLRLEILEPNLIVVPIPDKKLHTTFEVPINILISNNTITTFPFIESILSPELVGQNNQALPLKKIINNQIEARSCHGIGIPPKKSIVRCAYFKLTWLDNSLQLIGTIFQKEPILLNFCWLSEPIFLGIYQLRFTYSNPEEEFLFFDSHMMKTNQVKPTSLHQGATPWLNLRLVEPTEDNNRAVAINGINFETIVSETSITIPLTQPDLKISVPIGMKITNLTSNPVRFVLFDSLIPSLIGVQGLILGQKTGGSVGPRTPVESDFHLALPDESITLFPQAYVEKQSEGHLRLVVPGRGRNCWSFNNLELGQYWIQLNYLPLTEKSEIFFEMPAFLSDLSYWMSMVITPFVKFSLT